MLPRFVLPAYRALLRFVHILRPEESRIYINQWNIGHRLFLGFGRGFFRFDIPLVVRDQWTAQMISSMMMCGVLHYESLSFRPLMQGSPGAASPDSNIMPRHFPDNSIHSPRNHQTIFLLKPSETITLDPTALPPSIPLCPRP